jgi:hypothetical protein
MLRTVERRTLENQINQPILKNPGVLVCFVSYIPDAPCMAYLPTLG